MAEIPSVTRVRMVMMGNSSERRFWKRRNAASVFDASVRSFVTVDPEKFARSGRYCGALGVLLEAVGHNFAREERVSAAPHI
jgi:hypothetical protein